MKQTRLSRRDWLKTAGAIGLAAGGSMVVPSIARGDQQREPTAVDVGSRRELFVDHYLIDRLGGTTGLSGWGVAITMVVPKRNRITRSHSVSLM